MLFILVGSFVSACTTSGTPYQFNNSGGPTLKKSLFPSDQKLISQAAIGTILGNKIKLPADAKLAVIKFPDSNPRQETSLYGYGYWRSEDYLKLQQSYIDTVVSGVTNAKPIRTVSLLPSLLTPKDPTIPVLREAAVRLQAPLLLIFRINSDIYEEFRFFQKNRAKAFATAELVMLDVRTGIIPFTTIVTKDHLSEKVDSDSNNREMMMRTEQEAVNKALDSATSDLVNFFDNTSL
ncbi:hypothetical protein [Fodinibius halophilus]|uniref:ABC-type transport auxiliary lipoprotein component domain-containing protein n=1 Tax=Fodinibius halophilus TaxID=1736908 RepID=A0A6M1TCS2_9BACT|nr:hypothetical protein [Fodinibius halophilus]NGP90183.1 hypothetical protein [Fodinibius halophilus]